MPGPGCVCVYAMPPGGKSIAVAARDPARVVGVEHDRVREQRVAGACLARRQLPAERVAVDPDRAEVGLAPGDVERDRLRARDLDAVRVLVERERAHPGRQWKYCPPSITIVCPVTNDELAPAR